MKDNLIETIIGAAVIAVAGLFYVFASGFAGGQASAGYSLIAQFDNVSGVSRGSDVRMAGIKIGTVTGQNLDSTTYLARIDMSLDEAVKIPTDSTIKIASEGLLGGAFLSIEPGGAEEMFAAGDEFEFTQGAVDLVGLIGQAVFSSAGAGGDSGTQ